MPPGMARRYRWIAYAADAAGHGPALPMDREYR